jgi:hypothetical protein
VRWKRAGGSARAADRAKRAERRVRRCPARGTGLDDERRDPNALAQLLAAAAAAGPATMQPSGGSSDDAERGLRDAAAKHAAGMTPEGEVAKGTLSEGGHLGFIAKMDPTKCYTIVAYGAGVEDLDLYLLVPPFYNLLGAHDVSNGPSAVIGAAPKMCPISPIAIPYKIDMHAKKGGGAVAAQVFSKPK